LQPICGASISGAPQLLGASAFIAGGYHLQSMIGFDAASLTVLL
jgi:hypothetical protein